VMDQFYQVENSITASPHLNLSTTGAGEVESEFGIFYGNGVDSESKTGAGSGTGV